MNKRYTEKKYFKDFRKGKQTITMCCDNLMQLLEFDETEPFDSISPYKYYLVGEGVNRFYELEEKETPKKVKETQDYYCPETYEYEYTVGYCPICNRTVYCDEYKQTKYCPECGQRLDWSKEEEKTKE